MRKIIAICAVLGLAGCAYNVQLMARDSGRVYTGTGTGNGMGSGTMTVDINGRVYTGPMIRTGGSQAFGLYQQYGGGKVTTGSVQTFGMNVVVKALLSSTDNHGLRCELTGDGMGHGGGICVDDDSHVYDVLIASK